MLFLPLVPWSYLLGLPNGRTIEDSLRKRGSGERKTHLETPPWNAAAAVSRDAHGRRGARPRDSVAAGRESEGAVRDGVAV